MTAQNFDRDLHFIQAFEDTPGDSTSNPNINLAPSPRTDGIVYDDVGYMVRSDPSDFSLLALDQMASGVIMRRPEVRGVYRITGFMFGEQGVKNLPSLGIAVAPAAPTGAASGEAVQHWQFLDYRNGDCDPRVDITVCIDNFGTIASTDYSERDIIFYVSLQNISGATQAAPWVYSLSVQRLTVGVPEYESKYR